MINCQPQRLLIEEVVAATDIARKLAARFPDAHVEVVSRVPEVAAEDHGLTVEVIHFNGRFVKPCPGTRSYICCGYQIIHFVEQCCLGCTYCILQAYFPSRNLRVFANTPDMWSELRSHLDGKANQIQRFGTGEFTDSLLLEPGLGLVAEMVSFFGRQATSVLELKTKTDNVAGLKNLEHRGHTIVSWSLNPPALIASEEPGTASLPARLLAAKRCQQWGYRLGFHFDPLIAHPGWRRNYARVVQQLFAAIEPQRVAWVSLGTLRFMPAMREVIRRRYPESWLLDEEFVPGLDGKLRYFRDLRVEMYKHLVELLREVDPDLCVYLCMESEDVWQAALGFRPRERGGLKAMLDQRALP